MAQIHTHNLPVRYIKEYHHIQALKQCFPELKTYLQSALVNISVTVCTSSKYTSLHFTKCAKLSLTLSTVLSLWYQGHCLMFSSFAPCHPHNMNNKRLIVQWPLTCVPMMLLTQPTEGPAHRDFSRYSWWPIRPWLLVNIPSTPNSWRSARLSSFNN